MIKIVQNNAFLRFMFVSQLKKKDFYHINPTEFDNTLRYLLKRFESYDMLKNS